MQNISEIIVHAIDLSEFGKSPTGLPLWRVVWGPSRIEKAWWRETKQIFELKMYPNHNAWVLEKWQSALDWAGTKENFDSMMKRAPVQLEYPSLGEYAESMVFPDNESVGLAKKAVEMMMFNTTNITQNERILALKLREELKEKDADERASAMIRDALGATNWSGTRVKLYDAAGNTIQ